MSATGRGAERREADFYPTPRWCVTRLLERLWLPGGRWLEPCAGAGAIISAVKEVRDDVAWDVVELRDEALEVLHRQATVEHVWCPDDFLKVAGGRVRGPFPVCLTNPPFSLACEFVDAALPIAEHVIMLQRINWLGSEDRDAWWRARPLPDLYVLPNRPSFTGGGTDSIEYAWFHWWPGATGKYDRLALTPKAVRKAEKQEAHRFRLAAAQPSLGGIE